MNNTETTVEKGTTHKRKSKWDVRFSKSNTVINVEMKGDFLIEISFSFIRKQDLATLAQWLVEQRFCSDCSVLSSRLALMGADEGMAGLGELQHMVSEALDELGYEVSVGEVTDFNGFNR